MGSLGRRSAFAALSLPAQLGERRLLARGCRLRRQRGGIDDFRFRAIREFFRRDERRRRLGHRRAFPLQLLLDRALLLRQFTLADLELTFEVGPLQAALAAAIREN